MKIFDITYFVFLIVLIGLTIFLALFLKNKNKDVLRKVFIIWAFALFASHFLKQLVYWNIRDLHKSTAENICAVSTLIIPFVLMIKKDTPIKDYIYFIGIIGGGAGMLYPTEALNNPIQFETFRFYFCHYSLFAIPLLMAITGVYRPKLKNIVFIPLIFLCVNTIIVINEGTLLSLGYYDNVCEYTGMSRIELFFSAKYFNSGFAFGPTPDMGIVGDVVSALCLPIMKHDFMHISNGLITYWPVIWLIVPTYILFTPIYFLITFPFNKDVFKKKEIAKIEE